LNRRVAGSCANRDEEGVEDEEDSDRTGADVCMRFHKRRQDVREQRVADDDEEEVHRDDDQEPPIAGDRPESSSPAAMVRRRGASIRHHRQHDQRQRDVRDRVEQIERLKRLQVLCRGEDETGDCRTETETEVLCRSPKRERGNALLWRYQGDEQRLVCGAGHADPRLRR
jgi:hypothetical protein